MASGGDRSSELAGGPAERLVTRPLHLLASQARRLTGSSEIAMVPGFLRHGGRRLHFAVTDNEDAHGPDGPGSPPVWAVNIHGYFAGGGMYWRESVRLAERTGWRVVNPSLPGFGGSDPLGWDEVSMETLARQVGLVLAHVGAGPAVVMGHSMGGAVAVQYAYRNAGRTLGLIYRDGVATPAWRDRSGVIPTLLTPFLPDMGPLVDMGAAVAMDLPDLLIGRLSATVRSLLPDVRHNLRTMGRTAAVGSMLLTVDLRSEVRSLAALGLPMLAEWGCFDRLATGATAAEFASCAHVPVQWLPGGHSWMLARPEGQADVLAHLPAGRDFVTLVEERWRRQVATERRLQAATGA